MNQVTKIVSEENIAVNSALSITAAHETALASACAKELDAVNAENKAVRMRGEFIALLRIYITAMVADGFKYAYFDYKAVIEYFRDYFAKHSFTAKEAAVWTADVAQLTPAQKELKESIRKRVGNHIALMSEYVLHLDTKRDMELAYELRKAAWFGDVQAQLAAGNTEVVLPGSATYIAPPVWTEPTELDTKAYRAELARQAKGYLYPAEVGLAALASAVAALTDPDKLPVNVKAVESFMIGAHEMVAAVQLLLKEHNLPESVVIQNAVEKI